MATTYSLKAPDGNTYQIDGPPGATQDQIQAAILQQHPNAGGAPAPSPARVSVSKPAVASTNGYLEKYNAIRNGLVAGAPDDTQRQIRLQRFDSDPRAQQLRKLAGLAPLSTAQGDVQAVAKKSLNDRVRDSVGGASVGASVGVSRAFLGLPEMLAAAGERFLPSSITGNNSNASYSNILQTIRANDQAIADAHPYAAGAGELAGSVASLKAVAKPIMAGASRVAATGAPVVSRLAQAVENVGTLRKGQIVRNAGRTAVIGGAVGGAQAAGEGNDISTGAEIGAATGGVLQGVGSLAGKFLLRPAADVLGLSNPGQYLRRFTTATVDEIKQKVADFRAQTGAEPTLLQVLPLADRNSLIENTISGRDPIVEHASKAISERVANVQPEMADTVNAATSKQRLLTQRQMVRDLATANGGKTVPGDASLAFRASQSPTDLLGLRREESRRIMAPHDSLQVVADAGDLVPQYPVRDSNGTITMKEANPEISRVIRAVSGGMSLRPKGAGVTVREVTDMVSRLREAAGEGNVVDRSAADAAANHLMDLLDQNVPEASKATQQMRSAYAAHSRMAEGLDEGMQSRLRDEIRTRASNSLAQGVTNAYDTNEGTAGRQLGQTNSLLSDLGRTPESAVRTTIDLARNGNPAIAENLGQNAADQIQTAAQAQAQGVESLSSALAKAKSGEGNAISSEDLARGLLALSPHTFVGTKYRFLHDLMNGTFMPDSKARLVTDMLFSQDPRLTDRAVNLLNKSTKGRALQAGLLASLAGANTVTSESAPDTASAPGANDLIPIDAPTDADGTADAGAEAPVEAQEAPATVMGYPVVTNPDKSTWDKRADGSTKGTGFLGLLQRPDRNVSSEISVGVGINGKETEIPLMVPGLSKSELDYLMTHDPASSQFQKNMPRSILDKATAHATARINAGLSPFKQDDESAATPPASASPYAPALLQIYQNENPDLIHLIQRVKKQESSGDQSKVSKKGAVGVMQVMPGTGPEAAKLAGVQWDPKAYKEDPSYNELIGIAYLSQLLRKYKGDVARALAAYNAGPGKADTAIADHGENFLSAMPAETQDYVARVGS